MLRRVKKVLALILIISSMSLLFAAHLDFKAYYQPNNVGENYISVDVLESDGSGQFTKKVYQAATIEYEQTGEEGTTNTVFVVRIKGNFTGKVSLRFVTAPLQAQYRNMYYIPEHRFSVYKGNTFLFRIAEFNSGQGPAAGDYQFPNSRNGNKNTPVKSETKDSKNQLKNIPVTSTDGSEWTLDYPVMLTIVESSKSAGEFDYYSNITVEVDAEATT